MREVLTVQLGRNANAVGTHFWNFEEAYFAVEGDEPAVEHDVSFRVGQDGRGNETYTPRAIIYDFPDSFGALDKTGLYKDEEEGEEQAALEWTGGVERIRRDVKKSRYMEKLEAGEEEPAVTRDMTFWPDYSRVYFHPRSVNVVKRGADTFSHFANGIEMFDEMNHAAGGDMVDEHLRWHLEACDSIQGFQVLTGMDDGWSGFALRYVEHVKDELAKVPLNCMGVDLARSAQNDAELELTANMIGLADTFVPLTAPATLDSSVYDAQSFWHTSAVLGTAFETAYLPSRIKLGRGYISLGDINSAVDSTMSQPIRSMELVCPGRSSATQLSWSRGDAFVFGKLYVAHGKESESTVCVRGPLSSRSSITDPELVFPLSFPERLFGSDNTGLTVAASLYTSSDMENQLLQYEKACRSSTLALWDASSDVRWEMREKLATTAHAYSLDALAEDMM